MLNSIRLVAIASILLGIAGFLGNWFKLQLFFNVDFLFGSFFVMLAIVRYGICGGMVAGLIASACTYLLWNHPWAIIIFTAEAVCVALLNRRRPGNLVVCDTLYWLFLGMPLVWLFYHLVMGMSGEQTLLVALKQSINGIFNTLLATLALICIPKLRPTTGVQKNLTPFRELMFTILIAVTMIVSFISVVLDIRETMRSEERTLSIRLSDMANVTKESLNSWLHDHHQNVQTLCQLTSDRANISRASMQKIIKTVQVASPELSRMGILDRNAILLAQAPLPDNLAVSPIGKAFPGLDYVPILEQQKKPYVSDMLLSLTRQPPRPVIHLLAPRLLAGNYVGYCVGVVSPAELQKYLRIIVGKRDADITLLDRKGNIIVSTRSDRKPMDHFQRPTGGSTRQLSEGAYHWIPQPAKGTSMMQRWKNSQFIKEEQLSATTPWTIIVENSMLPYLATLNEKTIKELGILWGVVLLLLLVSSLLSSFIVRQLKRLELATTEISRNHPGDFPVAIPNSTILELQSLTDNFQAMTSTLAQQSQGLKQLNEELEQRVDERTSALHESEWRFRKIIESTPNLVMIHSAGKFVFLNPTALAKFGADSIDQLLDSPVMERIHPDYHAMVLEHLSVINEQRGQVPAVEEQFLRLDGSAFYVSVTTAPFEYEGKAAVLTIAVDITSRKVVEQKLLELNNELEQRVVMRTNELESINKDLESFCYSISHELRAPIARLEGFSRVLGESATAADTESLLHYAERIGFSSRRLMTVVDSLLMMHRISRLDIQRQEVNLSLLASEIVTELTEDLKQHPVQVTVAPDLKVQGDPTMLTICLQNLLSNACKYTMKTDAPCISFGATSQNGETVFFVRDNGAGFDMAFASKLFQPFSRLHNDSEFEGNGIGLATVQKVIAKHGGQIWAEAKPGAGATFFFTLGT